MDLVSIPFFSPAKLYLGQSPGIDFIEYEDVQREVLELKKLRIDYVVVLQTSRELAWSNPDLMDIYEDAGIKVIHFPIHDMQAPVSVEKLDRLVSLILQMLKAGRILMIHCFGGKGRTGLVAAAVLIKHAKLTALQAVNYIRHIRPGAIETPQQLRSLVAYERMVHSTHGKTSRRH